MKHESDIKLIGYPQETVYAKISDLNNLAVIRERFNDPEVQSKMASDIPPEKVYRLILSVDSLYRL